MRNMLSNISALVFMAADAATGSASVGGTGEGATGTQANISADIPANRALAPLSDTAKLENLQKFLPSQKVYPDFVTAENALAKIAPSTDTLYGLPIAVVGLIQLKDADGNLVLDDEGNPQDVPDPAVYSPGTLVRVGTLGTRIEINGKGKNGVKAVVVMPIPTVAQVLADEEGTEFIQRILSKEFALVGYRNIRDAATMNELMAQIAKMPKTVSDYLAAAKSAGSAADTETFDALWTPLRASLKKSLPALYAVLPTKAEAIRAIRSKSYATEHFPELENAKAGSIFLKLAQAVIANAATNTTEKGEPAPLDSSAIADWIKERDTTELGKSEPKDYSAIDSLDLGGFGGPVTETTAE